jgi:hypothetical protein
MWRYEGFVEGFKFKEKSETEPLILDLLFWAGRR